MSQLSTAFEAVMNLPADRLAANIESHRQRLEQDCDDQGRSQTYRLDWPATSLAMDRSIQRHLFRIERLVQLWGPSMRSSGSTKNERAHCPSSLACRHKSPGLP